MPALFEAYVTNLGKYNEGELVGEYLKFPATPEEVQALLKRIGVDGVRYSACLSEPTPQELLERMERFCDLWNALNTLPETQGRRVDACIILGKSYREVAQAEGVNESSVRESVKSGLENMKKYLKKVW